MSLINSVMNKETAVSQNNSEENVKTTAEKINIPDYVLGTYDAVGDPLKWMVIKDDGIIRYGDTSSNSEGVSMSYIPYSVDGNVLSIEFDEGTR